MNTLLRICFVLLFGSLSQLASAQTWQWAKQAVANSDNYGNTLKTDASGNIYVTGKFRDSITLGSQKLISTNNWWSLYVAKYSPSGEVLWAKIVIYGDVIENVFMNGIAVDPAGEISITGRFAGRVFFGSTTSASWLMGGAEYDIFVSHLNSDGEMQWTKTISGSGFDYSGGVSTDRFGNIFVCGELHSYPFNGSAGKIFLAKYGRTGNLHWFDSSRIATNGTFVSDIKTDANGNTYLIGSFFRVLTFDSILMLDAINQESNTYIAKFSSSGENLWLQKAGDGGGYCGGTAIAVDENSNCVITGYYRGKITLGSFTFNGTQGMGYEPYVAKLDQDGKYLWANRLIGVLRANDIAIDANGNSYLTGTFGYTISLDPLAITSNNLASIFLFKIDQSGKSLWATQCSSPKNASVSAISVNNSTVVLTGSYISKLECSPSVRLNGDTSHYSAFVATLDNMLGVKQPDDNTLSISVRPNPSANGHITISSSEQLGDVSIYDILGKCIYKSSTTEAELQTTILTPGAYRVTANAGERHRSSMIIVAK